MYPCIALFCQFISYSLHSMQSHLHFTDHDVRSLKHCFSHMINKMPRQNIMKAITTIELELGTVNTDCSVGFSTIPDQIRNESINRGFELNILVVGRRGSGSSTLVNSLFAAPLVNKDRMDDLTITKNQILENDICLETSTATYHHNDIGSALEYIETANKLYFEYEQGFYKPYKDCRVHLCLYMIPSDRLTEQELLNMEVLSRKTNLIPVIPKADMYTPEELVERKKYVLEVLCSRNIAFYNPSHYDRDDDFSAEAMEIEEAFPLATIASESVYDHQGEIIRGRKYVWGFINIDSEECNDFKKLQKLLIYSHLDDLINRVNLIHYNEYRMKIVEENGDSGKLQKIRYKNLKSEMEKILKEKYLTKLEALRMEEETLDKVYMNKLVSNDAALSIQRRFQKFGNSNRIVE